MITRAWTDATADGEIWIYPVADCNGVYLEIRAVSDGKAITWSVSPSEAGVLVSLLKDVAAEDDPAEKSIPANPPASTQEPSEPEKDEGPQLDVFVPQQGSEAPRTGLSGLGAKIADTFSKLSE